MSLAEGATAGLLLGLGLMIKGSSMLWLPTLAASALEGERIGWWRKACAASTVWPWMLLAASVIALAGVVSVLAGALLAVVAGPIGTIALDLWPPMNPYWATIRDSLAAATSSMTSAQLATFNLLAIRLAMGDADARDHALSRILSGK